MTNAKPLNEGSLNDAMQLIDYQAIYRRQRANFWEFYLSTIIDRAS